MMRFLTTFKIFVILLNLNAFVQPYPIPDELDAVTVSVKCDFEDYLDPTLTRFFLTPFPLITLPLGATFRK